jgi:hypothetical protein
MEEQEKNLEGFIEGLYNVKIKPEYFSDDLVRQQVKQQLEEIGFTIKMENKSICIYNIKLNIPDEITKSEKPNYIKEKEKKLNSLVEKGYAVYVEKSVKMKALDKNKALYDGSNPV